MGEKSNVGQPLVQASLVGEAIDAGPIVVLVADDEMRFVAVNGYACELLGYGREELLALRVTDIVANGDAGATFRDFVAAGDMAGELAVRRKDGTTFPLVYRATTTTVAGLTHYVSVGWPAADGAASGAPRRARRSAPARD